MKGECFDNVPVCTQNLPIKETKQYLKNTFRRTVAKSLKAAVRGVSSNYPVYQKGACLVIVLAIKKGRSHVELRLIYTSASSTHVWSGAVFARSHSPRFG